jgi:hypothetical protein
MDQVLQEIWNQIAEEETLKTKWAQRMFNIPPNEIEDELDKEYNRIMTKVKNQITAFAFIEIFPLLAENEAIENFLSNHPRFLEQKILSPLWSIKEAIYIASKEFQMLKAADLEELTSLMNEYLREVNSKTENSSNEISEPMDQVIIKTKTKDLLQVLKMVKGAVRGKSVKALSTTCEITVTDGKATFAVPGAIFTLECITEGTCKATIPFNHFMQIIQDTKVSDFEIIITKGNMKIGNVTIHAQTTFFATDRILRTIHLPINYTDGDLLRLSEEGYTWEELKFNKLTAQIHQAEENLQSNIIQAYKKIKQYGITHDELEKMVLSKLYPKSKNKE